MNGRLLILSVLLATGLNFRLPAQPRPGGQIRLAIQAEPKTLDPALAADEVSELVRYLTGGVLIRLNRLTQKLEPELALSWKSSAGGRRLTFRLRGGVRFSDGAPFSSRDVCATISRLADARLDSPVGEALRTVKGGTRCAAESELAATLEFGEPVAAAERMFDDIAIQPARAAGPEAAVLGPFRVAEQKPGAYLVLSRNPHYWKKDEGGVQLPYLDSIRLDVQRNRDFELARFRRGELDLVNNLAPDLFEQLKTRMPKTVHDLGESLDSEFLWFNQVGSAPLAPHKKAWFRSREFRLAISEAIHRADIVRIVFRGHASAAVGPVSPANLFWVNAGLKPLPAAPQSSLARLARSGFDLRGGVLRDGTGNPVEFSLITNAGNRSRERMAAMIQQDLAGIGIRVALAPMDFASLIDRITRSFQYEACLLGFVQTDLDPLGQMGVWLSSGPQHQWNPNQPKPETDWETEIDRLMRTLATEPDLHKRKKAFDRVQEIVVEQAPVLYLVNRNALLAVSPELGNVEPSVLRPQILWNADRLYRNGNGKVAVR